MVIELLRRICNGFLLRFRTLFRYVFGLAKGNGSEQNQLTTFTKSVQSPISALIIGIDKYASDTIPNTKGAVPSANAFYTYIKNTLGVPDSQIQILLDEDATRENIMNELLSLRDKRGGSGDPIVIYFAGHGNMGTVRDASGDRKVEMILPCDCGVKGKKTVHGIEAGTISMILEDIAKTKGDNIILILDCDFPNQNRVLPSTLDSEITKNHLSCGINHTSHSFIAENFSKFIVITAGDEVVTTQPQWKGGYLTNSLLEHLTDLKTLNLSYNDFYKLLPEALILHVAGDISSRQLFDGKVTSSKYMPVFFKRVSGQSVYKLSTGLDEGVRMGSVYSAYSGLLQALDGSKASGTLSVTSVTREESTLTAQDMTDDLEAGYAVLKTVSNALHVHLSDNLLPTVTSVVTPEQLIQVSEENAVLSLSLQQNVLRVVNKDNRVISSGLSFVEVECDLKRESIQYMIKGLAHYHYILNRASDITVNQIVSVDLFRLSAVPGEYTKDLRPYRVENGESLVVDGEAQVPASRSVPYGIKISNHTSLDFYAYLFFMDNYDFSIMSYYISHANSLESRLAANSSIKIGYEDSDHPPVIYYLRPGVNVEVGFIKLFVSTEPLDMSRVAQDSPFDFAKVGHEGKFVDKKTVWGAASAKIVQVPPDSEEEEYDD